MFRHVDVGRAGLSEDLRAFVAEAPWERTSILAFVMDVARSVPPGATVLDVGAGDAPYAELFGHADYRTNDWEASVHEGAAAADVVAPADAIPWADGSVDVVLCTQVLEHVPDPASVLREIHRLLRPEGGVHLTVPLAWELHELPHDYYRYTAHGLEHLLEDAGFTEIVVAPRNDCFATIAQLLHNMTATMGRTDDGQNPRREEAGRLMQELAGQIAAFGPLDARGVLPLGYEASARRAA